MSGLVDHLVVVPVVLPLVTAAVLVLLGDERRALKPFVNVGATAACALTAGAILWRADAQGEIDVYLAANWEAPFGIVLVADRLAAMMLVLVGAVGLGAALFAEAGWARAGVHFHPLFQIQLMGLNGAFLTGDLFNLFVFFEVMLAASYGLQLHGSGRPRVSSGLHYIAVNLLASSLFLIGLAVLYGVMGTLSMADVADKLESVPASDRGLLHAGAAILGVAFLVKAAMWPLNAWLMPAYTATSAPVAGLFVLMTKVGVYVLLRLSSLFFSGEGTSFHFGAPVLLYGGLATIAFGAIGVLSTMRLGRIAAYSVIVSSGTLLAALGLSAAGVLSAALFYMLSATLAVSALFLLVELIERAGADGSLADVEPELEPGEDTNLDDTEAPLVGRAFPVSDALLGLAFLSCAVLVAGLPPLSGFVAKLALLRSALELDAGSASVWWFFALVLFGGLTATIALSRAGIRSFWSGGRLARRVKVVEALPVLALVSACLFLTAGAEAVLRYTSVTAAALRSPREYIDAVMSRDPRPGPTRPSVAEEAP